MRKFIISTLAVASTLTAVVASFSPSIAQITITYPVYVHRHGDRTMYMDHDPNTALAGPYTSNIEAMVWVQRNCRVGFDTHWYC
jgi:hypothetical protein